MSKGLKKEDSMALKGIAVLMLVFHHCYRTAAKFEQYDVVFCGLSASQVITAAEICKICVAIFAFVSGYGLMYGYTIDKKKRNTRSISAWTLRHILSVMSGFWFVSVIFYGIYICLARNGFYKWGENAVEKCFCILADVCGVSSFLGTKSLNGAWWYMSAAVTFILLFPVLDAVMERFGELSCLGMIFLLPRITGKGFPGGSSPYSFLMIFAVGMVCCRHDFFRLFHEYPRKKIKFVLLLFLLLLALWGYSKMDITFMWERQYAVTPFLVILFSVEYLFRLRLLSAVFQYLGKHSMNIWLVHIFVRDWLNTYVYAVRLFWLIPVVILMISLGISYFLDLLKKYTGYDRLFERLQERLDEGEKK